MFCSTIIPTIGRPVVERAVESVLQQELSGDTFEVIVVNDSGQPLPFAEWQQDPRVRIVNTNRRERSVARNTGAALASGSWLHFLDDDDWLLPGAYQAFYGQVNGWITQAALAHQAEEVHWLYGRTQLMDRREQPLIQLDHGINGNGFIQAMSGEWIPLQSSLIAADAFWAAGGFEPRISGPEDIDLLRRMTLKGALASVDAKISCLGMGAEGSSTDTTRHAERSRWARETILNQPRVFQRMSYSAKTPAWRGRWVRIYLTSMVWNLRGRNGFIAASRVCHGIAALVLSFANWFGADFWVSITSPYESDTFANGEEQAQSDRRSTSGANVLTN